MKLTILERLLLGGILPNQGSLTTLKLIRILREDLSFSVDEHQKYELREEDGKIKWNPEFINETKDIEINDVTKSIIKKQLRQMDKEETLTENHVSL